MFLKDAITNKVKLKQKTINKLNRATSIDQMKAEAQLGRNIKELLTNR